MGLHGLINGYYFLRIGNNDVIHTLLLSHSNLGKIIMTFRHVPFSFLTIGATRLPNSSIDSISLECDKAALSI